MEMIIIGHFVYRHIICHFEYKYETGIRSFDTIYKYDLLNCFVEMFSCWTFIFHFFNWLRAQLRERFWIIILTFSLIAQHQQVINIHCL